MDMGPVYTEATCTEFYVGLYTGHWAHSKNLGHVIFALLDLALKGEAIEHVALISLTGVAHLLLEQVQVHEYITMAIAHFQWGAGHRQTHRGMLLPRSN
jgi:hypothetical protein